MIHNRTGRSEAAISGRLSVALYDGLRMDDLANRYGLERAEQLLRPLDVIRQHNLFVLSGRNLIRNFLNGDVVAGISRYAIGTDATAPAAGNTGLGGEVWRNLITQTIKADGILTVKLYVPSLEANGHTITEAGSFAGDASDLPNSGTLVARATFPGVEKTSAIALVISHDHVIKGV